MLEGWSALAFAAGQTNHIQLGTLVTGVTYRHPGLLVKTATTLDVLSHGRAYFGVGAAWNEQEHRGLGVPFPSTSERFERLEELLQISLQMWSGDEAPYNGKHYQLERPLNSPTAVSRPHPPILIGGSGEQKTLRLVAKYADACNLFVMGDEVLGHKLDVLRAHASRWDGRTEIEKTCLRFLHLSRTVDGTMTPSAAVDFFAHLADLGFDQAIIGLPNVTELDVFDLLATEVIPQVEKILPLGK